MLFGVDNDFSFSGCRMGYRGSVLTLLVFINNRRYDTQSYKQGYRDSFMFYR